MTPFVLVTALAGLAALLVLRRRDPHQVDRIERKLDLLLERTGIRPWGDETELAEVTRLLREGRKIEAIRVFRAEHPGMGLKQAREAVDALAEKLGLRGARRGASLDRLERKIDAVLERARLDPLEGIPVSADVAELARQGRTIDAIKALRAENPGTGLAEAREVVERLGR